MTIPIKFGVLNIGLLVILFFFSWIMFVEMVRYSRIRRSEVEKKRKKKNAKLYDYLALGSIHASTVFFVFGTAFAGVYIVITILRML